MIVSNGCIEISVSSVRNNEVVYSNINDLATVVFEDHTEVRICSQEDIVLKLIAILILEILQTFPS